MCYKLRRQQNHNYGALCPGNLMKPVVSAITSTGHIWASPSPNSSTIINNSGVVKAQAGPTLSCIVINSSCIYGDGPNADFNKLFRPCEDCISHCWACKCCWIMLLLDSCLPSHSHPSPPSFPPILAQIICGHIHPAALLRRFNLFSPLLHRPSLPTTRPIHLLWGRPPLRVIKCCWRAVMLTNTLII